MRVTKVYYGEKLWLNERRISWVFDLSYVLDLCYAIISWERKKAYVIFIAAENRL